MCAKAPGAFIQAAQPGRLLPQPSPSWTAGREWKLGRAGVAAVGAPERLSLLMAGRLFPHHPPRPPSAQLGTRAIPLGSTDAVALPCVSSPCLLSFSPAPRTILARVPACLLDVGIPRAPCPMPRLPKY